MPLGGALTLGAAAGSLIFGTVEAITSAAKLKKDKKELARLKQPFMKIQDEYFQNRNIAAEQAQGGMPAATKDFLASQRRQGLGSSIAALLQSGVQPGDVGKLFKTYDDSISADAARDAEMKTKNIDYFIGVNKDLAGQKTTQFVVNELAPYERKLKQLTEKAKTDESNITAGVSTALSGVSSAGASLTNASLLKSMTGKGMGGNNISQNFSIDNGGLTIPQPGMNPEATNQGGSFNWYTPNTPTPGIPSPNAPAARTANTNTLTDEQLQEVMNIIQQAFKPKE